MDIANLFKNFIEQTSSLNEGDWGKIEALINIKTLKKNEILEAIKKPTNNEYFVGAGVLRSFILNENGEEVTLAFYPAGGMITPFFNRNINGLALYNIQATKPSTIIEIDALKFNTLIRENNSIQKFAYSVVDYFYKIQAAKEICFISKPAAERLQFFRDTYPGLENEISQKLIASYLGISPVSLSRLRSL